MKYVLLYNAVFLVFFFSCKKETKPTAETIIDQSVVATEKQPTVTWSPYDESEDIVATQKLKTKRMHLKLINSKVRDKNAIWEALAGELDYFGEKEYNRLSALILEKDIPTLQQQIKDGKLTYEALTKFFVYRIRKYESDNATGLNAVIALNPNVIEEARALDRKDKSAIDVYSVYGMPILLKDNINYRALPTTAGAIALSDNQTNNAFIVNKLLEKNALILGKANLSEWAYYMCADCPVGYSAIGGQTLNPYGRMLFEPGGSSSGSGVAVATNYCVAAVGTETSGSIVSPSSQNAVVGFKPSVGLLSRTGIVPISNTLDTAGPMTKNVVDAAILFSAMLGKDVMDSESKLAGGDFVGATLHAKIQGVRIGVIKELLQDSLYNRAVSQLQIAGATIINVVPKKRELKGFLTLLNMDMKSALPAYVSSQGAAGLPIKNVEDVVTFNKEDEGIRMPYGQELLEGIVADKTTEQKLESIKAALKTAGKSYFEEVFKEDRLQVLLSINNYHSGYGAVANYPMLTVPMGFTPEGEPKGLTFIASTFADVNLLKFAYIYEQASKERKIPEAYTVSQ